MILVVERLSIRRGSRIIVDDLSLTVEPGEIVGLVGPNGCGKSTALSAIAGVLEPRGGRVLIEGIPVWGSSNQRATSRAKLGYVPEGADPPGFLTADELWNLCAAARGASPPTDELRAALGLDDLRAVPLEKMSLGMRRRTCLGAALLGPPKLLVLDEPDNGLDVQRLNALVDLLRAFAGAVILASHDDAWLDRLGARRFRLQAAAASG